MLDLKGKNKNVVVAVDPVEKVVKIHEDFDWSNALYDAFIIFCLTFFSVLGASQIASRDRDWETI